MLLSDLDGKSVGILGAGREGKAVAFALLDAMPEQGFEVFSETPVDDFFAPVEKGNIDRLRQQVTLTIGPLSADRLTEFDILVRSPGVSPYRSELKHAKHAGVAFTTSTNLWMAANPSAKTVAITGTKGKSTTTALVCHLLNANGARAEMAGNIGRALIECDANDADWWVLELSSYQICDLQAQPDFSVLLNLSDEHLDWHGSASVYRNDKLRLAALTPSGHLVANSSDAELFRQFSRREAMVWFNQQPGFEVKNGRVVNSLLGLDLLPPPGLLGTHNLYNLAAALTVVELMGELPADPQRCLQSFTGLPHRLNLLGETDQHRFYDDSLSTTPVATLAALEALSGDAVTVLVGGLDRGIDWSKLVGRFSGLRPFAIIGMPDSGSKIVAQLKAGGLAPEGGLHTAHDLAAAVTLAQQITPAKGAILLSPGAPSFPRFENYIARGTAFSSAIDWSRPQGSRD